MSKLSPSDLRDRVERERRAHTESDVLAESRRVKARFAHIEHYPARRRVFDTVSTRFPDLTGQTVLDLGCGDGERTLEYLRSGAHVFGIDISPMYVAHAMARIRTLAPSRAMYDLRVMDAHELDFPDCTFDLVMGRGVLHHLEWRTALRELHRVTRPGGCVIFQEPLADNPLLRLFRRLTPAARTPDECPFTSRDLEEIEALPGWDCSYAFCGIFSAPLAVITSLVAPGRPSNRLLSIADRLEIRYGTSRRWRSWNQYVHIELYARK